MKKNIKITYLLILSILVTACGNNSGSTKNNTVSKDYGKEQKDVVILSTNDVNSAYNRWLGYDGLKLYIDSIDKNENYVTLVDTGCFSSGTDIATKSEGKASIELMKELNYDLIVPGCHEFDYGMDKFYENMNEFGDKVVCCNLYDMNKQALCFKPYEIFKYGDIKIAFVGVTSPEALFLPENTSKFFDDDGKQILYFCEDEDGTALYSVVQENVDKAIEEGANKVILLAHLGCNGVTPKWSSTEVIAHTKNIDAVIDGHSEEVMEGGMMTNRLGLFVPIVQAGHELQYVGCMNITKDGYAFPAVTSQITINKYDEEIGKRIKEIEEKYN